MLTADDCGRSWRGVSALLARQTKGLADLDDSEAGFWISFRAFVLTAPAFVVALAVARRDAGLSGSVLGDPELVLAVAAVQAARLLALPLAMAPICLRLGWGRAYVPFVVATNWIDVFAALGLAIPGLLFALDLETPALTGLFTLGFAVVVLHARWFAAAATLGIGGAKAGLVTGFGLALDIAITLASRSMLG